MGIEQGTTVFGHEAEEQTVYQAKQGAQVVPVGQLPSAQRLDEPAVAGVVEESIPKVCDCPFYADSQLVQGAGAGVDGVIAPCFQPAVRRPCVFPALLGSCGVGEQEHQQELGVELPVEDRLQVELQVCRPGKGCGVAQHSQPCAVGQQRP